MYELKNNNTSVTEISFRGKHRYTRRLSLSKDHIIGPAQLVLTNRGSLDYLSTSILAGFSSLLSNDTVEVSVRAVGLNFKDVLNVLVPDEAAYVGYEVPPLPGSDFSGVVTKVSVHNLVNNFAYSILCFMVLWPRIQFSFKFVWTNHQILM